MKKKNPFMSKKIDELTTSLREKREELRTIRFSGAGAKGKGTANIRTLKRDIARILTELTRRAKGGAEEVVAETV